MLRELVFRILNCLNALLRHPGCVDKMLNMKEKLVQKVLNNLKEFGTSKGIVRSTILTVRLLLRNGDTLEKV
jgi:hypothetical protein